MGDEGHVECVEKPQEADLGRRNESAKYAGELVGRTYCRLEKPVVSGAVTVVDDRLERRNTVEAAAM